MTQTWNFTLRQGEAKRLRLSLHEVVGGPVVALNADAVEFRADLDGQRVVVAAAIANDEAVIDFGAVDTSAWPPGRHAFQVWFLNDGAGAPVLQGRMGMERGF